MREWLTVIVVLLIVGILLDGWRRMRLSRQNSIKMSLSMHQGTEKKDLEAYGSELPNGGARVVGGRDDADNLNRPNADSRDAIGIKPAPIAEQVALNLDESVPMLMDVEGHSEDVVSGSGQESGQEFREARIEPTVSAPLAKASSPVATSTRVPSSRAPSTRAPSPKEPSLGQEQAEEVLVINVMAQQGHRFNGGALLDVILSCGLRYGAMNIFHRHLDEVGEGEVLFSMANMVKPGTFDLNAMEQFETPGVSLFMTLPLEADSLRAFNIMVNTAEALCEQLGGELKDENRSVMTKQTMEHCRHRIREFERKQLSRV